MIDGAAEHALFDSVVHFVVGVIIRVAYVGSVAKGRQLEVGIKRCSEMLVVTLEALFLGVLRSPVVLVCTRLCRASFQPLWLHVIRTAHIELVLFVPIHVSEEVV